MKNIYPAISEEQSEINRTPMLGVVFIMLIFFVVTASFIKEFGLDITLPAGGEVLPQELETIKVVIEYDDSFHVNGREHWQKEVSRRTNEDCTRSFRTQISWFLHRRMHMSSLQSPQPMRAGRLVFR